jgi:capsular exopolysaccharide synthesis family protein
MSRVFEALTKAHQERERETEKVTKDRMSKPAREVALNSVSSVTKAPTLRHIDSHELPAAVPKPSFPRRSWRDRLSELVSGWDLRRYTTHPIVALDEESPASEQYIILRKQLKRLRAESGIRTVAITSPSKRDGKTTVSVNLAAAIAMEDEEKVVLIDADLRGPIVHRYFNEALSPGLADYFGAKSPIGIESLIRETRVPGLGIITAGKPSRSAKAVLGKERNRRMLKDVQRSLPAHVILIDSPPVLSAPDPLLVSRQVDGVIMVIRAGKTPKDSVAKALSSLKSTKILGIVLNGADVDLGSKDYSYYSNPNSH